ncbi:MAG: ABC transporter permease [Clostridiaceae bacterium]|nr:ABC transporter permease [Clostridiaceae bacterium]
MENNLKTKNPLLRLLGGTKYQFISIPIFAIICSLIVSAIIILIVGQNPLMAYKGLLQGAGVLSKNQYAAYQGQITDFMETLDKMTPMLFASLAVAIAMQAGLFNIGVSGQMLISGFIATIVIGYSREMSPILAKPLVAVIGVIVGALAGGLIGFLKIKFNINEVVSSIMLNYIFQYVISFFINTKYVDPVTRQSRNIGANARLTLMQVEIADFKMRIPIFFIVAILIAIVMYFFMKRTDHGLEISAIGFNRDAARYAGINVKRRTLYVMLISGGLAGLAGVTYYLGYQPSILPKSLSSIGFDSIAVSLLGSNNPLGIIFSSFLITVIDRGATYMRSAAGVEQEIAALMSGIILLFSAMGTYMKQKFSDLLIRNRRR